MLASWPIEKKWRYLVPGTVILMKKRRFDHLILWKIYFGVQSKIKRRIDDGGSRPKQAGPAWPAGLGKRIFGPGNASGIICSFSSTEGSSVTVYCMVYSILFEGTNIYCGNIE